MGGGGLRKRLAWQCVNSLEDDVVEVLAVAMMV